MQLIYVKKVLDPWPLNLTHTKCSSKTLSFQMKGKTMFFVLFLFFIFYFFILVNRPLKEPWWDFFLLTGSNLNSKIISFSERTNYPPKQENHNASHVYPLEMVFSHILRFWGGAILFT